MYKVKFFNVKILYYLQFISIHCLYFLIYILDYSFFLIFYFLYSFIYSYMFLYIIIILPSSFRFISEHLLDIGGTFPGEWTPLRIQGCDSCESNPRRQHHLYVQTHFCRLRTHFFNSEDEYHYSTQHTQHSDIYVS